MRSVAPFIPLLALACGDVTGPGAGGSDGAPADGGSDAAVPGLVTVTVLTNDGRRAPSEDTPVVFFQPDGTVEASETTGEDGVASAELLPGGAVMAFVAGPPLGGVFGAEGWAVVGVKPGDEITLGGRRYGGGAVTSTMTIQLPAMKSGQFYAITPCGSFDSGTRDVVVEFYDWCDDAPSSVVGYAMVGDTRLVVTDDDITIDDLATHIVDDEYGNTATPDVTVEGLQDISSMYALWTSGRVGDHTLNLDGPFAIPDPTEDVTGDSLTQTPLKVPQPENVMLSLTVRNEQAALNSQTIRTWMEGNGNVEPVVLDFAELALPWVGSPIYDPDTRLFQWPQVGDGEWDATFLQFYWSDGMGKGGSSGQWIVLAPPGRNQFVLPPVPEEFEAWLPPTIENIYPQVRLFDSDQLDWDEARQLGLDPYNNHYQNSVAPPATVRESFSPSFDG